jgi:integral membrane protein (TIGR01906 family)
LLCYDLLLYGLLLYGLLRYGLLRYGLLRYGLLRYGLLRYGLLRYGLLLYGLLRFGPPRYCQRQREAYADGRVFQPIGWYRAGLCVEDHSDRVACAEYIRCHEQRVQRRVRGDQPKNGPRPVIQCSHDGIVSRYRVWFNRGAWRSVWRSARRSDWICTGFGERIVAFFNSGKTAGRLGRTGPADVGAALLLLVFLYSVAVVLTLNFRPLYYLYIQSVGWPASVGISMDEIMTNYDALITYNSVFFTGPLEFPTLDMSSHGRIHYEEVKRIFVVFQIACIASAAILIPVAIKKIRRRETSFLKIGGIASILFAAAIVVYLGLDWNTFFVRFHETFFDNDYWIFDSIVDPSILILPDGYFMACAVMIFALVIGLSIAAVVVARRLRRREG